MKYVSFGRRVVVTQFAPFSQECVCDWQTYIYFKRTKAFCVFYKKSISNEYKYICIQFHWIAKWLDAIHKKKNIRHSGVYWRGAHTPPCTYVLPLVWLCPSHSFAPLKWNPFLVESIYYVCDQRSARQRDCPTNNRTNSFWFEMRIKGIWNMFSRGADEKKVTSTMPDKSDGRTTDGGASHIYRSLNQLHLLKYNKHRVVIYLLFPASSIPRRPKHWIDEHWKWHSMSHNIMQETIMVAQDHTHIHSHLTPHTNHLHLPCITDTLNFACGAIIRLSFHCPNWIPNDFADPIDCVCACVVFVIEKKNKIYEFYEMRRGRALFKRFDSVLGINLHWLVYHRIVSKANRINKFHSNREIDDCPRSDAIVRDNISSFIGFKRHQPTPTSLMEN